MARMTQTEIISRLAESCGCKKTDVKSMLDTLAQMAVSEVRTNGEFTVPGFGKLKKTQRKAREGRNPATGAGGGVAAFASFPLRLLQLSEAGNGELTIGPDLAYSHLSECVEHGLYVRFLASARFRQAADDFRLCHT